MTENREHILDPDGHPICGHPWGWRANVCSRCMKASDRLHADLTEAIRCLRRAMYGRTSEWERSARKLVRRYAEFGEVE